MSNVKVIVTTDTNDLLSMPKSVANAILANVKTSIQLDAGKAIAADGIIMAPTRCGQSFILPSFTAP